MGSVSFGAPSFGKIVSNYIITPQYLTTGVSKGNALRLVRTPRGGMSQQQSKGQARGRAHRGEELPLEMLRTHDAGGTPFRRCKPHTHNYSSCAADPSARSVDASRTHTHTCTIPSLRAAVAEHPVTHHLRRALPSWLQDFAHDVAVLVLSQPLGSWWGYQGWALHDCASIANVGPVKSWGYPGERTPERLQGKE